MAARKKGNHIDVLWLSFVLIVGLMIYRMAITKKEHYNNNVGVIEPDRRWLPPSSFDTDPVYPMDPMDPVYRMDRMDRMDPMDPMDRIYPPPSWLNKQRMMVTTVSPTSLTLTTSIPIIPTTIPPTSTTQRQKEEQERLIDQDILFYQAQIQQEERQKRAREAAATVRQKMAQQEYIKKQQEKNILCNIRNGQVRCIPFKRNQYFH